VRVGDEGGTTGSLGPAGGWVDRCFPSVDHQGQGGGESGGYDGAGDSVGVCQERRAEQDLGESSLFLLFHRLETDGVVAGCVDRASVCGEVCGSIGKVDVDDDLAAVWCDADVLGVPEAGLEIHGVQADPEPCMDRVPVRGRAAGLS
jgi:hypothetical protein